MDLLIDEKLDELFSVYGLTFGFNQDLYNFLQTAKSNDVSLDQLIDYLKLIKDNFEERQGEEKKRLVSWKAKTLKCPECKAYMRLADVNTNSGNQTGDLGDKSVWMCPNQNCLEVIYNKETIKEILNS